jgi:hypothetical protein
MIRIRKKDQNWSRSSWRVLCFKYNENTKILTFRSPDVKRAYSGSINSKNEPDPTCVQVQMCSMKTSSDVRKRV